MFILSCSFYSSCSSDEEIASEYFVFGASYGHCIGDCTHLYKLENKQLYPDDMARFDEDKLVFQSKALDPKFVEIAQSLIAAIPDLLYSTKENRFGCPDCHDQGTYHIRFNQGKNIKSFYLDPAISEKSYPEIKIFNDKLGLALEKLRN